MNVYIQSKIKRDIIFPHLWGCCALVLIQLMRGVNYFLIYNVVVVIPAVFFLLCRTTSQSRTHLPISPVIPIPSLVRLWRVDLSELSKDDRLMLKFQSYSEIYHFSIPYLLICRLVVHIARRISATPDARKQRSLSHPHHCSQPKTTQFNRFYWIFLSGSGAGRGGKSSSHLFFYKWENICLIDECS